MRGSESEGATMFEHSGGDMIKNGGDVARLLQNNCHFQHLIAGSDSQAFERVCKFVGRRLEELGYVLVHHSDMEVRKDHEGSSDERHSDSGSVLSILNISSPDNEG